MELEERLEAEYKTRKKKYDEQVAELRKQKEDYLKENPNDPLVDILFMNVIAPPQKIEIKIVV